MLGYTPKIDDAFEGAAYFWGSWSGPKEERAVQLSI
jgi:hypothetical protein